MTIDHSKFTRQIRLILDSFDDCDKTHQNLTYYGIKKHITFYRWREMPTGYDCYFTLTLQNDVDVKTSERIIWFIGVNVNIRIDTDITEERFFQESTINDYKFIDYSLIKEIQELIRTTLPFFENDI